MAMEVANIEFRPTNQRAKLNAATTAKAPAIFKIEFQEIDWDVLRFNSRNTSAGSELIIPIIPKLKIKSSTEI